MLYSLAMTTSDTELVFQDIERSLVAVANPVNAEGMARYMRNQFSFLGVKTPERRKASKRLLTEFHREQRRQLGDSVGPNWELVERLWSEDARELHYVACDYLLIAPPRSVDDAHKLKTLVTSKSWWDTVDPLSTAIGFGVRDGAVDMHLIRRWAVDKNMWVRRVAIICQRGFKAQTDTELLAEVIAANAESPEFFIRKAIGWALRDYSKTNPAWVKEFLHSYGNSLSSLSVREASKYLVLD